MSNFVWLVNLAKLDSKTQYTDESVSVIKGMIIAKTAEEALALYLDILDISVKCTLTNGISKLTYISIRNVADTDITDAYVVNTYLYTNVLYQRFIKLFQSDFDKVDSKSPLKKIALYLEKLI